MSLTPAILIAWLLSAICGYAQSYSINWFNVAGGGGASTGGTFAVQGTVGQSAVNPPALTGGDFSLVGGFWSAFVVQTPGAPRLTIAPNPQAPGVIISWPSPSTGFLLQERSDLNESNWVAVFQPVNDNGTTKFVVLNPPGGKRFYRLIKP